MKDDETLKSCTAEGYFYIQYICLMPEVDVKGRQVIGLALSCLCVFLYFFNVIFFDFIDTVQKTQCVDYDVKTITGDDYTVEFNLKEEQYDKWKTRYHDLTNPMSEMAQFK